MRTRTAATATAAVTAAAIGVAGVGLVAIPAHAAGADKKAHGSVGGARYELSAEKEHGYELEADLDRVPARSTWRLVISHDGTVVSRQTQRAHRDDGVWDVDFRDVHRRNSPGKDVFVMTLDRVGGPGKVTRTFSYRR